MKDIRICPVCLRKYHEQALLRIDEKRMICPSNHSFDIAAGGYVNLLPPSAGQHGDNKAMVLARRRFLNTGIYEPLRKELAKAVTDQLPSGSIIWDSGCGEGYYTSIIAECDKDYVVYGSDLSTVALIESHKRCPKILLTTASSYALPVADHSCDAVICLFAPEALDEFKRILKPGGYLFLGYPGRRHLFGLKEVLYATPYENTPNDTKLEGFTLVNEHELFYQATVPDNETIMSLFEMTPYAYRTGSRGREALSRLSELETEFHFHILTYRV